MNIRAELQNLKDIHNRNMAIKENIEKDILNHKTAMHMVDIEIEKCDKAAMILTEISLNAKRSITMFLEDLVTDALQYISEGQYKFCIEIDDTGKTTKCEFYVTEEVDGVISKQKPQDACGGGFIDIISTTLRYAYLNLYNKPALCGPVILDEPGKMVSAEMSVRFGEFIKQLGDDFNRQTIMITHNDNLTNIADAVEEIVKV